MSSKSASTASIYSGAASGAETQPRRRRASKWEGGFDCARGREGARGGRRVRRDARTPSRHSSTSAVTELTALRSSRTVAASAAKSSIHEHERSARTTAPLSAPIKDARGIYTVYMQAAPWCGAECRRAAAPCRRLRCRTPRRVLPRGPRSAAPQMRALQTCRDVRSAAPCGGMRDLGCSRKGCQHRWRKYAAVGCVQPTPAS